MMNNSGVCSVFILLLVWCPTVFGQAVTNTADGSSRSIYLVSGSNTVGWAGANYAPRIGEYFGEGADLVLSFQLPDLSPATSFDTAVFGTRLFDLVGGSNIPFTVDLYGLTARSANAVIPTDYYVGSDPDTNAVLIQSAYFNPGMSNGAGSSASAPLILTSNTAHTVLLDYLNAEYDSGNGAGQWIFLRLSPATNTFSGNHAYSILTPAAGETWAWPYIAYTVASGTSSTPDQVSNQTIIITFPVQGLAYAKLNVSPTPLSADPIPSEGTATPSVINPTEPVTYQYTYSPSTTVTISRNHFTGSEPNTDIRIVTVDYNGVTQRAQSVTTLALDGSTWSVEVYSVSNTNGTNTISGLIPDPYTSPAPPQVSGAFKISFPTNGAMVTSTRRPQLSWDAVPGASRYDVYLNVTQTNYDWMAPGALLDRFLLMTQSAGTSWTLDEDLPDRWTYKWFVEATDEMTFTNRSDLGVFSLYLPDITSVEDGVTNIMGMRDLNKNGAIEPYEDWRNPPSVRAADLASRMTFHEKVMQLFFNAQEYPEAGWAFGPFQPADLLAYQKSAATNRLGIPFIAAGDTIHGYKTSYPTQPGLAATRNLHLSWAAGDVQRRESHAVGYRGTLSPLAEVGTKVLYPRIQEGCGEDADLAAGMVRAMVAGLQGGPEINPKSIMITTKHWCGQGAGGEAGVVYDGTTIHYHMRPWHAAIEAGTSAIMPGYAGSELLGPDGGGAGDNPGIIGYLRTNLAYQGVICTDWLPSGAWVDALEAGSDVMGGANPDDMGTFESEVSTNRVEESLLKVLDLKFRMGLFEDPYNQNVAGMSEWHTPEKVAVAKQAAVESLTLLENNGVLPLRLSTGNTIVVTGPRAQDGSCMVTWNSAFHEGEFGSKTIYDAMVDRAAAEGVAVFSNAAAAGTNSIDAAVVVVGESYYTHGTVWDKNSPWLPDDPVGAPHDIADGPQFGLIQYFESNSIPVVTVCMLPRPYVLSNVVKSSDALMVVYRPGDEGGTAIAEMLFGDHLPSGKTPWQLPRGMDQVGIDDTANWSSQPDKWDLPFDLGATTSELAQIRAAIAAGDPVPPTTGDPLYQYGSGLDGFGLVDATPPEAFATITPSNGIFITGALPAFSWEQANDPETGIARYEVFIDDVLVATTKSTIFTLAGASLGNGAHSWYVRAYNWADGFTNTPTASFAISDTNAPSVFSALLPLDDTTVSAEDLVTFIWEQSTDDGTGIAGYQLLLDGANLASVGPGAAVGESVNLASGKTASASSTNYGVPGDAVDGDPLSRWSSDWVAVTNPDLESITVDLGAVYSIKEVRLTWEAAYGKEYIIQSSLDGASWDSLYHMTNGLGGTNIHTGLSGVGQYVRMQGLDRGSGYGYSLWEFEVYGLGTEQVSSYVPGGEHSWYITAMDGAGNVRTNSNSSYLLTSLSEFMLWQIQHFGSTTNPDAAPGADPVGTGQDNLFKYIAGLDPTNSGSVFTFDIASISNRLKVSFGPVWTDRMYRVESRNHLVNGNWGTYMPSTMPGSNTSLMELDAAAPDATSRFYRVEIALPE